MRARGDISKGENKMANKNHVKLGVAAAAAVAAGATVIVSKNKKEAHRKEVAEKVNNFRNTERGRFIVHTIRL